MTRVATETPASRQGHEVALRCLVERYPGLALTADEQEWVLVPGARRPVRLPLRLQ